MNDFLKAAIFFVVQYFKSSTETNTDVIICTSSKVCLGVLNFSGLNFDWMVWDMAKFSSEYKGRL